MGVKERRLRERIKRNNQIIDAAEAVIFNKGIHKATMEDIAKEAELGKGTLYGYYRSKAEILLAINERALRKLGEMFAEASGDATTGAQKVKAIGKSYIRFAYEYPEYYNFISLFEAGNIAIDAEETAKNAHRASCELMDAIKCGMEDGSMRKDLNPEAVSKCLWAMCTGIVQLIHVKGDVIEKRHNILAKEIFKHFFDIVDQGLMMKKYDNDLNYLE